MIARDELIELGRYNKPHGVNGELSATLDCDCALLSHFTCLVSEIDGIFVPFFLDAIRPKNVSAALLTLDGIGDERQAAMLVNKDIYVRKQEYEQLMTVEDADGYPLDFFIGFEVLDAGKHVGCIVDVDDATDNVLFVVERKDKTIVQIPAADDLIVDIDEQEKSIEMDLPEGLLSL